MIDLTGIQDMATDRGLETVRYGEGEDIIQVKAADALLVFVQVTPGGESAYVSSWGSGLTVVDGEDLIFVVDQALSDFPF